MRCPKCGQAPTDVIDSRRRADHVWRKRRCRMKACKHVFQTMEIDKDRFVRLERGSRDP